MTKEVHISGEDKYLVLMSWPSILVRLTGGLAFAGLAFMLVCAGLTFLQVKQTAKELPVVAQQTIHTEFEATRTLVSVKMTELNTHVDTLYKGLSGDVRFLATTTDTRLGKLENDTFTELANIRKDGLKLANDQLTETNKHVGTLVTAYAGIPKTIGLRLDPFTDCAKNKLCLQGQAADTLFALRTTSRDVSTMTFAVNKVMPSLADSAASMGKSGAGIATDVHTATTDFVTPKTTWQKIKAWLETAGKIGARFL